MINRKEEIVVNGSFKKIDDYVLDLIMIADGYGVYFFDLDSSRKTKPYREARSECIMYLLKKGASGVSIARLFKRDQSFISKVVKRNKEKEKDFHCI